MNQTATGSPLTGNPALVGTVDVAVLTAQRLGELDRLRGLGMQQARRLAAVSEALPPEHEFKRMTGLNGTVLAFERVTRAIRQIVALEFELRGLFKAPDRAARRSRLVDPDAVTDEPSDFERLLGDFRDRDDSDIGDRGFRLDYKNGPMTGVVASIRKTLGAEPPQDDPFAPPPEPQTPKAEPEIVAATAPSTTQRTLAVKAVRLAVAAMGGRGFRMPSKRLRPAHAAGIGRKPGHNRGPPK